MRAIRILCATCLSLLPVSGGATLCTKTDTGMARIEPYAGVRSTCGDWKHGGEKPWSDASPNEQRLMKTDFRTIDLPLSLVADTLFLPFDLKFMDSSKRDVK